MNRASNFFGRLNGGFTTQESLEEKVAIITGASSGIGKALALAIAKQGGKVVLASRNIEKLRLVKEKIAAEDGEALVIQTDVTKLSECERLVKQTLDQYGKIDILINNAGISMRAKFTEVNLDVLKKLMDTNFWGAVYCTKLTLDELIKNKGTLIAVSSICGITPLPGRTGYAASKHALDGFMETVRVENLENNLNVITVHPGFTNSEIRLHALNKDGEEQAESPRNENAMMSAEEVAHEVISAIKNQKRNITLTTEGKLITWIYKNMPSVADKLLLEAMHKEEKSPV